MPARDKSTWPKYAGLRSYRRANTTGALVGIYDGIAAGLDTTAGRWQTICEKHGTIVSHRTSDLARRHATHPEEWCEGGCMNREMKTCLRCGSPALKQQARTFCSRICSIRWSSDRKAERFWDRVDQSGGLDACWPWLGKVSKANGYGRVWLPIGKERTAHRVAYERANGMRDPLPPEQLVLHHCDNRPCCNPRHLYVGTPQDNVNDMVARGRNATGDRSGARKHPDRLASKLTPEQVRLIRDMSSQGAGSVLLGQQFGVTADAVRLAVRRRTWKHVT